MLQSVHTAQILMAESQQAWERYTNLLEERIRQLEELCVHQNAHIQTMQRELDARSYSPGKYITVEA